jgi:hypothetical protein
MNAIDKETKYFRAKGRVEDVKKLEKVEENG